MKASPSQNRIVRFGVFEVDLQEGEVRRSGLRQKLGPQPFQVLQAMLARPGELVTRDELRERLWPDKTYVDHELALKKCINRIRQILGDSAESQRFIETVPRRGYRFIAPVEQSGASVASDRPTITVVPVRQEGAGKNNAQAAHKAAKRPAVLAILVGAIGIFIVLGLVITLRPFTKAKAPGELQSIRSLAVLPLENLSGDPAEDYFTDGLTDELITALAQTTDLRVISRTSVMQFKSVRRPVADIARQLNVDGIIEGTVVRSGEHVRITAQLIHAPVDRHLWAQSYERDLRDIVALQDDVARSIASAVKVRLIRNAAFSVGRERSVDPEAYDEYLKGRYELNKRNPADLNRALEFFQRAIDRDSIYAPAYSGLADTYALLGAAGYDVYRRRKQWRKHARPRCGQSNLMII
jgi:TolB-like protein/DNA-binding winged helix-turn-helix (wHTH) protein